MAKKRNIPLFCICRGAQLLNVYEGGTLFTNVKNIYESTNYPSNLLAKIFFRKSILIEKKSHLYDAFQKEESTVNSMHSQSIDHPGKDLETTSMEPIGVIQSVENSKKTYIVGVQFHPEFLIYRSDIRRLFKNFVNYCKK